MLTTIQRLLWSGMVCCCLALAGCDTVFDVHPYDVHIRGEKNLNAKALDLALIILGMIFIYIGSLGA